MPSSSTLESKICNAVANEYQNHILLYLDSIEKSKSVTHKQIWYYFGFRKISSSILSNNIRKLLECGLIEKTRTGHYSITFRGKTCVSILRQIEDELD